MRDRNASLTLNPKPTFWFTSAAHSELLPQPKPRAMREHFVVPSIGSSKVACAEWPNIRPFEHFLKLLNIVDDAFNVHSVSISDMSVAFVKRGAGRSAAKDRDKDAPSNMITVKLEKTIRGWLRIKRFKVLQERLALIKQLTAPPQDSLTPRTWRGFY